MSGSDPVADLIARHHLRRLTRGNSSTAVQALHHSFGQSIIAQLQEDGFSADLFERIDRITDLCDSISFAFCFEQPAQGTVSIFPRNGTTTEIQVRYTVEAGAIQVVPWPFSVKSYIGYIVGYHLPDYPNRLDPVILPFVLSQGT